MCSLRSIILASTSIYRKELLKRLNIPFTVQNPKIDETPENSESGQHLAKRLARAKARAIAKQHPQALVVGSDQVAMLDNILLAKPGSYEKAYLQLQTMRGRTVVFYTAVSVQCVDTDFDKTVMEPTTVRLRTFNNIEIERYLRIEQPYDCAGSAKSEGLGISLAESMMSHDPTALIGLPLIHTCHLLRLAGVSIP
jgi:septum formation protein